MRIQQRQSSLQVGPVCRTGLESGTSRSASGTYLASRPGFTLLELIVVITIIAVLAALTTGVAMRFFGIQQQRNSEVAVTKVSLALERQWKAVIDQASQEPLPPTSPSPLLSLCWSNPNYPSVPG